VSLRVCNLGSGSGGNCTLIESKETKILIDAARLGQGYIADRLSGLGVRLKDINGIFATHMHGDHVDAGVTYPICRKYEIPLYIHEGSNEDLIRRSKKFIELDRAGLVRRFHTEPFSFRELQVRPFNVPHGSGGWNRDIVGNPVGFRISLFEGPREISVAYATDLGMVPEKAEEEMVGADVLVIECNHDVETERRSERPRFLVDWVTSARGHLSNDQTGELVKKVVSRGRGKTRHVMLAHLSEDCNSPELAMEVVRRELSKVDSYGVNLCCALQHEPSEEIII